MAGAELITHQLVDLDVGIGGHARLQFVVRIFHVHLDAIDQHHPLLLGLHALGRELRVGGDDGNVSAINFARG